MSWLSASLQQAPLGLEEPVVARAALLAYVFSTISIHVERHLSHCRLAWWLRI